MNPWCQNSIKYYCYIKENTSDFIFAGTIYERTLVNKNLQKTFRNLTERSKTFRNLKKNWKQK